MATDYGRDTLCTTSLKTGRLASSLMTWAQNQYHRLVTRRGQLRGSKAALNYGKDLREYIGQQSTPSVVASIPGIVRAELTKDPRTLTTETKVTPVQSGPEVSYLIEIRGYGAEGTFDLVMDVSSVSVKLLKLEAA